MTLLILAAGLGSRYGGLKQLDPVTKEGEFIIDFSVYDAIASGFDKIVFVIKEENLALFRDTIGKRFEKKVQVEYAFQSINDIPNGTHAPTGRTKPWGTAHAVWCARHLIRETFAVINADDFYGRSAFSALARHLSSVDARAIPAPFCMVGYQLKNTLTENGTVSRGICDIQNGYLTDVTERTKISKTATGATFVEGDKTFPLALDTIVSMNCWGFTPNIFSKIEEGLVRFLSMESTDIKREYYLPFAVKEMMDRSECTVRVYPSHDAWYGVTYREDHEAVVQSLAALKSNGTYPQKLNNTEDMI